MVGDDKPEFGIYERDLDRGPANYQPLTPLTFLAWSASVYPGNVADLANAALESNRCDVVLSATVGAAADLDVSFLDQLHEFGVAIQVLGQDAPEPA